MINYFNIFMDEMLLCIKNQEFKRTELNLMDIIEENVQQYYGELANGFL